MSDPRKRRQSFGGMSLSNPNPDRQLRESPTRFLEKIRSFRQTTQEPNTLRTFADSPARVSVDESQGQSIDSSQVRSVGGSPVRIFSSDPVGGSSAQSANGSSAQSASGSFAQSVSGSSPRSASDSPVRSVGGSPVRSASGSPVRSVGGSPTRSLSGSPRTISSPSKSPRHSSSMYFKAEDTILHELLGRGGSASVYRGTVFGGMSVAVKVCQVLDTSDYELVVREIELLNGLNHLNILSLLGSAELTRKHEYFIYMELCSETLRDLLNKRQLNSLGINEVKEYFVQISNGLKFLHELEDPIIHLDIKSHNVFVIPLRDNDVPLLKIGDFGESVRLSEKKRPNVGTIEFRAPELFSDKFDDPIEYGTEVDIWSLGMTLYELITLRVPYRNGSITRLGDLDQRIARGERPNGLEKLGELSIFLKLFESCTSRDPNMRPSARKVIQELREIIE